MKFLHMLCALSLMGTVVFCLIGPETLPRQRLRYFLLMTSALAALTGTLLVYPAHYTFHTPWIIAAYLLLGIFCLLVALLVRPQKKYPTWLWRALWLILLLILIMIAHDAVTRSTLLTLF